MDTITYKGSTITVLAPSCQAEKAKSTSPENNQPQQNSSPKETIGLHPLTATPQSSTAKLWEHVNSSVALHMWEEEQPSSGVLSELWYVVAMGFWSILLAWEVCTTRSRVGRWSKDTKATIAKQIKRWQRERASQGGKSKWRQTRRQGDGLQCSRKYAALAAWISLVYFGNHTPGCNVNQTIPNQQPHRARMGRNWWQA